MEKNQMRFGIFCWRVTAIHMITYFVMGLIASALLDYRTAFANPPMSCFMRSIDSPWVVAGPMLQVIRGIIFSVVLWIFKEVFLFRDYGWLKLWGLLIGLSILSTTGPAPGSIEGLIYTKIPVHDQLKGYLEVMPQTLLFSVLLYYWNIRPKKAWNYVAAVLVILIIFFSTMGVIFLR